MATEPRSADHPAAPPPIRLRVVPPEEAAGRPVLESGSTNPLILEMTGPSAFACGGCGAVLLASARGDEVPNVLLACAACGACNAGPA